MLLAAGPKSEVPVLLKIWKLRLHIVTMWFGPTAPLGSGGETPLVFVWALKVTIGPGSPFLGSSLSLTVD